MADKAHGIIAVYSGNGKGKTTAALGCALRALGHDMKVLVVEFVKHIGRSGEHKIAEKIGNFSFYAPPDPTVALGSTSDREDLRAKQAWEFAKEKIHSREFDMIILDAINNAIDAGHVDPNDVVNVLRAKPRALHLFLTGKNAKTEIVDHADLVTDMQAVRHHNQRGIKAQRGIEF